MWILCDFSLTFERFYLGIYGCSDFCGKMSVVSEISVDLSGLSVSEI